MVDFLQLGRPLEISTPLPPGSLLAAGFRGREAISELFAFEAHLLAPVLMPPLDFNALLGKVVTLTVVPGGGSPRLVSGTVMALRQAERDRDYTHFHATIRPSWWLATLRKNSRTFQQVTVADILKTVLGPFGALESQLTATYPNRDFTCQYEETDWAFASRLMQEEGIFFYFTHSDKGPTLVLADGIASAPAVDVLGPLRYDSRDASPDGREYRVWTWDKTQTIVPTAVTLWDNHFEYYRQNLEAEASVAPQATAGEVTHKPAPPGAGEVPTYEHGGDYAKRYDGVTPGGGDQSAALQGVFADAERTARLRAEAYSYESIQITAEGNCPLLTPGFTFDLTGHYDADGKYYVAAVEHVVEAQGTFRAGQPAPEFNYTNRFDVRPPDLVPRPARTTPRPKIGGHLTAVVVGPAGQEIFVDKYGRVKVQFLWDRLGKSDADSSCWIRCAQLWAGKTWGAFFWPRIGMEVVVQFEDGDIDRPLITGCVYNGTNMPPTTLPADAAIGGIKSLVVFGNPAVNFNAIYIHDTPGVEYIQVHSEKSDMQQSEGGRYHYTQNMMFDIRGHL